MHIAAAEWCVLRPAQAHCKAFAFILSINWIITGGSVVHTLFVLLYFLSFAVEKRQAKTAIETEIENSLNV